MSPIMLESLFFLKLNLRLWKIKFVLLGMKMQTSIKIDDLDSEDFYLNG